ncbi:SusC/RagA family TonB-linked outer membrane protein [Maribacter sp.]|uniref:SusC/RagA family TonB-linked outer membrane protein n=1 Tax=Maribacter sp. TaxID=1897614 RepID=UPI0025B9C040|nr:SusC/RagA family TonB-linked outer membrane protein [Maribacter sp.]
MRTKLNGFLTLFLVLIAQVTFAQEKTITGIVTDDNNLPLPGVNIVVEGTTNGTQTDFDGNFSINGETGQNLIFTYIGMKKHTATIGASSKMDIQMVQDAESLDEVVVTALGITRQKKSLGYSTQKVSGEAVAKIKDANFMNSLSGKVSGVQIKSSGTIGGSTNVIIRGNSSLTGNNQALFVIDGVLVNNSNNNTQNQTTGRGGYDYGNAASDINPDDIESINVLKGGAASALYGSQAANGVVIITTKTGRKSTGLGVTFNSSLTSGKMDESTYTEYQNSYGAGYGPYYGSTGYFEDVDVNNDGTLDLMVPSTEDASYGGAFDPSLMVYQWDSFYPKLAGYGKARPWLAAKNTPVSYFETAFTTVNSVALAGGSDKGDYRVAYTNFNQSGILPNSLIKKNTIDFGGSLNLTEKLSARSKVTYTHSSGLGRYGTGYDAKNPNQSFKQWFQTNVDLKEQKDAYFLTKENVTWNTQSNTNRTPAYMDNPYWTRYENYQNDERNRIFGHVTLNYQFNDWLSIMARGTLDTYNSVEEERIAVGSVDVSEYRKRIRSVADNNYDLYFNIDKNFLNDEFNVRALFGVNAQRNKKENTIASTTGGLVVPRLYALSNSKELSNAPFEYKAKWGRNSLFTNISLGYKNTYFIEGSYRHEKASTLPSDDNEFGYAAISGSLILSNFFDSNLITFAKLRGGFAQTGNAADELKIYDVYNSIGNLNGSTLYSLPGTKNNAELKDELSEETEIGLEMKFAKNRLGFDVSAYNKASTDQIMSVSVTTATGYNRKWVNAGKMTNKGVEVSLFGSPIKTDNFEWKVNVNWAKNENEVVSLYDEVKELQLASVQGGVSINATVGQPYGTIKGFDNVYDSNGSKVIGADGYYLKTDKKVILGDINPEWTGGINNSFTYKNWDFSFLIDVKKGGSVFSLDTWYGYATGIYANTVFTNDLGNPVRNSLADGGGVILDGVLEDGSKNTTRVRADYYKNPWGYKHATNAEHVYDAGFVKLREMSLSYSLPSKLTKQLKLSNLTLTAIGKNLWIIDKSTPFSDPEAGLSSGNVQGYQSGAYPSVKEYGLNLKVQF